MKLGNGSTSDWWFTLPVSEPYSLHVGCGGSPASWAVSASTPLVNGPHNSFDCHDVAAAADYQKCISR
jgi:hypothetical protein